MTEVYPTIEGLLRLALDEVWLSHFEEERIQRMVARLERARVWKESVVFLDVL